MSGVRFCSGTNSTLFTTCCGTAICDDQADCPHCGEEVLPRDPRGRWNEAMVKFYGRDEVRKMREEARKRFP